MAKRFIHAGSARVPCPCGARPRWRLADTQDGWIARYRAPLEAALETVLDHLGTLQIDSQGW